MKSLPPRRVRPKVTQWLSCVQVRETRSYRKRLKYLLLTGSTEDLGECCQKLLQGCLSSIDHLLGLELDPDGGCLVGFVKKLDILEGNGDGPDIEGSVCVDYIAGDERWVEVGMGRLVRILATWRSVIIHIPLTDVLSNKEIDHGLVVEVQERGGGT